MRGPPVSHPAGGGESDPRDHRVGEHASAFENAVDDGGDEVAPAPPSTCASTIEMSGLTIASAPLGSADDGADCTVLIRHDIQQARFPCKARATGALSYEAPIANAGPMLLSEGTCLWDLASIPRSMAAPASSLPLICGMRPS